DSTLLVVWQSGVRHGEPSHVLARNEDTTQPKWCPGVVKGWLPCADSLDRIRDNGDIVALDVVDSPAKPVCIQMVLDDALASPAGLAAVEARFPASINIEKLGNLGILKLIDRLNMILIRCLFIDQVSLDRVGHKSSDHRQLLLATELVLEGLM